MPNPAIAHLPKIWEGETVILLGGGPSLASLDKGLLKGQRCIGINNGWEISPEDVDVCYFGDFAWWEWNHRKVIDNFGGLIVTDCGEGQMKAWPRVTALIRDYKIGLQWKFQNRLCWCKNSGATAINLAVLLGASRILLLGYDMKATEGAPNKGNNWHGHHKRLPRPNAYAGFIPSFLPIKHDLDRMERETGRRVEVINCTPESALDVFPKLTLEVCLSNVENTSSL